MHGRIQSVADVSFSIAPGQTLALVGESGSGKSVTSLTLMGLHAKTSHAQVDGEAWFVRATGRRVDLLALKIQRMRPARQRAGHDLPGADDQPEPGAHHRRADCGRRAPAQGPGPRCARHALRMLELVEIPAARAGCTSIRTSCPAACASA
jgi:peptide/nickel transport system ATP-binding protein